MPAVAERLRSGELCFTSIIEVARVVTPENWQDVLPRFHGLSRREAAEVVAALLPDPAPPVRTVMSPVRPVHASSPRPAPVPELVVRSAEVAASRQQGSTVSTSSTVEPDAARVAAPAQLVPLTAEQRRLHVTVSAAFAKKLEQARAARPDLSDEALLEAGLDLLLAKSAKREGLVERPRKTPPPSKPEHVPAHVKREVWKRDGGRCQYRLASGEVCGETHDLQLDHVVPRARGGASTADNLRVTCRAHDLEAARLVFGDAWMDVYCGRGRGRAARPMRGADSPGAP